MALDYINEAFKKLDLLNEQMFDPSLQGIKELSDFMEDDIEDETIRVIDPNAESEEDLQDSYVGKVIINCNVCHSHIFENKDEVVIEEGGVVNNDMQCPYCGEQSGFIIIGEIAPYEEETKQEETTPVDATDSVEVEEQENIQESVDTLVEDFKEISITTEDQHMEMTSDENGKVTVTTEPVLDNSPSEEMIVPLSDATETEILNNNEIQDETEEIFADNDTDNSQEDELTDISIDEVDEDSINEIGESYLRKVYENVESFKTTDVSSNNHTLIIEGIIKFSSGVEKKTGFLFESRDMNSRGQLRFVGYNKHFTESKDAFSLVGTVDNKKLFVESLKYNYKVNNDSIRGVVRRK